MLDNYEVVLKSLDRQIKNELNEKGKLEQLIQSEYDLLEIIQQSHIDNFIVDTIDTYDKKIEELDNKINSFQKDILNQLMKKYEDVDELKTSDLLDDVIKNFMNKIIGLAHECIENGTHLVTAEQLFKLEDEVEAVIQDLKKKGYYVTSAENQNSRDNIRFASLKKRQDHFDSLK